MKATQRLTQLDPTETWTAFLQRRVMCLLLLHDPYLFHNEFHRFYTGSSLADHSLLQFYDRHIKLLALSKELLNDILPGIHLQWSLFTEQTIAREESPVRGQIDWQRTVERANRETPGQFPLHFATRLRQQHSEVPENLLVVAILLNHIQIVRAALQTDQQEEILMPQERQLLINIEYQLERELARPQLQALTQVAQRSDLDALVEQVRMQLHPGSSPYRDLLDWWERFATIRIGSPFSSSRPGIAYSHKRKQQADLWLYELWIALEIIALLQEQNALISDTLTIVKDQLSFIFSWNGMRYQFRYQRRDAVGRIGTHHWDQIPAVHPSYLIERDNPLLVKYKGTINWQEPPVVIDLAYGADQHSEGMQRLLGNMVVYAAAHGLLLSTSLPEPQPGIQMSGEVRHGPQQYNNRAQETHIGLYHMLPDMTISLTQQRILAILQHIVASLPERPRPACCGVVLDRDSSNASGSTMQKYDILCLKPHIGPDVYDLVSRERHCLQDPRLCHVMGQAIIPPQVKRVENLDDLKLHIEQLQRYGVVAQRQAEHDEEGAERLRTLVLQRTGEMIEQYVRMHGNTTAQEKFLKEGIFREYWAQHPYHLESDTCNILISGEYVWDEYQGSQLNDWAAPAIQYCRALEREIKRRFYMPVKDEYTYKKDSNWTLGSIKSIYNQGKPGDADKNWQAFTNRALAFQVKQEILIEHFVDPMVIKEQISDMRNDLAHGNHITRDKAAKLRNAILSINGDGIMLWLVKHIGP